MIDLLAQFICWIWIFFSLALLKYLKGANLSIPSEANLHTHTHKKQDIIKDKPLYGRYYNIRFEKKKFNIYFLYLCFSLSLSIEYLQLTNIFDMYVYIFSEKNKIYIFVKRYFFFLFVQLSNFTYLYLYIIN